MRRAKRNAAKLLSAAMAVGMMAGMAVPAAAEEESTNIWASDVDTSEPMELKMYLIGDRTPDFDEVYGKINEILEEKLNCTLSVDFLSWGEHDTKYSLLFSGGEDFDLIFTASSWGHYEQTVALGGFSELTEEDIQTYAPGFGMLFQKWHGIRQKLTAKFIWSQIIQTSLDRMFWQFAAT